MMSDKRVDGPFAEVARKVAPLGNLVRAWELTGGVSASVTGLEIRLPGGDSLKMVVRQHGEIDRRRNPHVAADEFRLLELLHANGLAAPVPYLLDQSSDLLGTPYIVSEYVEGRPEFSPADPSDLTAQLATQLAKIHELDSLDHDLSFLPRQEQRWAETLSRRPASPDDSMDEGRIRAALESAWPFPLPNRPVLLHGDYWPGNILWRDGRLAAVIDWEDAAVGDPLADVANGRLEAFWAFGGEAMTSFTHIYRELTTIDFRNLPYWDLCAALRPAGKISAWAADGLTNQRMRERHHWFVGQALAQLSGPVT